MQKLVTLLKQSVARSETQRWNLCREYLQVLILKSLFGSSWGKALVFQGGTCLRVCYDLKRYSEDLDFSLIEKKSDYSFKKLHAAILKDLSREGFEVGGNVSEDKTVQKAFICVGGLPGQFGFSMPMTQKLAVKLEVDVRPPAHGVRETHFVSRMNEIFPILKYDLPTLFAGKALALLCRPYERGRDYYDLIWYLSRRVIGNMAYFKSGMKQAVHAPMSPETWDEVLEKISDKVERVKASLLVKELRPFLEDPADLRWLKDYPAVFQQLVKTK